MLILSALPLWAGQYGFRHYTVKHGLPSPNLYQVLQDRAGYLWFATDNGVSRYDGHSFRTFTTADRFTDYGAFHIMEDSFGRLWFMTFSGKVCWYRDGKFTPFTYVHKGRPVEITWVVEDRHRALWICTRTGLVLRMQPNGAIESVQVTNDKLVHAFPTDDGVVLFSGQFYFVSNSLQAREMPYSNAMPVMARFFGLKDGTVLLTNNTGVFAISGSRQRLLLPFGPKMSGEILHIYEDNESNIWIGGTDGVHCFSGGRLAYEAEEHLLAGRSVTSVLRDHEGNYWFTTNDGAYMLPSREIALYSQPDGSARQIVGMRRFGERGVFLLARDGTLSRFHNNAIERLPFSFAEFTPLNPDIVSLIVHGDSLMIRVSQSYGFVISSKEMQRSHHISALYRRRDGSLWLYHLDGIYREDAGVVRKIYPRLDSNIVYSMYEQIAVDDADRCWIGTRWGLYRQDGSGIIYYGNIKPNLQVFVIGLAIDSSGNVWAATRGQGVFCIRGNTISQLTTAQGLACDNCSFLKVDGGGSVWVGGRNGLSCVAANNGKAVVVRTYSAGNILPSHDISAVEVHGDTVYVAGSDGLAVFDRRRVHPNTTPPPVYITRVVVGGRSVAFGRGCTLDYHSGAVAVEYTGISFRESGIRAYRFRMLPADTTWNITRSGSVQFPSLESGSYRLEVSAQNSDGVWSAVPASLAIVVRPPYWQSWWFRAAVVGAGLAFFAGSAVFVVWRQNRKNALQRLMLEMELRALRSQMNPHFIFNALNSIQDFILHKQSRTANLYLTKFARLMRMILEHSRQAAITLESELEFLQLYIDLEQLRFEPSFVYQIRADAALAGVRIPPMILQPVVENAIKHGIASQPELGLLRISFEQRGAFLHCTVEDNGVGREEAERLQSQSGKAYESIGLANTRERLALAHGNSGEGLQITDLYDAQGKPAGTRVEIVLPMV